MHFLALNGVKVSSDFDRPLAINSTRCITRECKARNVSTNIVGRCDLLGVLVDCYVAVKHTCEKVGVSVLSV